MVYYQTEDDTTTGTHSKDGTPRGPDCLLFSVLVFINFVFGFLVAGVRIVSHTESLTQKNLYLVKHVLTGNFYTKGQVLV